MAIQNPRIFGLAVPRNLTDIKDSDQALLNLGLDIRDLEVIRGIAAQGFDSNNLQTISGLNVPIWKTFDRYRTDISTYNGQLNGSAGTDFRVAGNIEVHGPISANAFRYTLFDNTIGTPSLRWGDISTSRVSSWSSFTASIAYGSDVKIAGTLFAGTLKTQETPTERTFDSEVPTHKIKLRLNGTDQYFYVMKGIPIRFKGFFRDFDFTLDFQTQTVRNSWRVYRTNGLELQDFENIGSLSSSTLKYRSPFSAERFIEAYINPEIVERIVLSNCNIQELPKSRLPNLETLIFANNGLTVFPDLNFFSPALQSLNIDNNPFYNGPTLDEKKFSKRIMARIPDTLTNLDATGCFKGGIQQNIFNRLKVLSRIDINRTSDIFFFTDSLNPTGALPNFYGLTGVPASQAIGTINLVDHDFRTIEAGVQGGIDEVTLDGGAGGSGGSGYNGGGTGVFNDVPLTGGSGSNATADITIDTGIVVDVTIKNVGSGYDKDTDTLSANNADLGGTGSGLAIKITEEINVLSIKQLENLSTINVNDNDSLNDPNFSLNCPTTLTSLNILRTQLAVPNVSNFTELEGVDFYGGSGRGSFHTGWDGVFGSANYPRTDAENFKFNNCPVLSSIRANYSDIRGYLPKYSLVPSLINYNFYVTNNIIAGRPGKRKILKLLQGGGITQLGAFNVTGSGRPFTGNQTTEVADTLENANATEGAIVSITTNNSGQVTQVSIVQSGSGYTLTDLITIPAGALGGQRGGTIDIAAVATGTIGSNDYNDGVYTEIDDSSNTFAGINGGVTFTIIGGAVSEYSLINSGQDYQSGESITIPTSVVGGTDPLQFIIEEAEAAKILYNDQFTSNPNIISIDININNSNFAGEVESGAFVPVRESLRFLRLEAAGRITGNFPNLEDQLELREVRSSSQGWSGTLPSFSSSVFLEELYLGGNNFTGTFLYSSKNNLREISLGSNKISLISNESSLPACTLFQMDNNDLSGNIPLLSNIMPNVQSLGLANNAYTGYIDGTLNGLLKVRTLDLSGNRLGVTQVDNILFNMVDNWKQANRSGVIVNLTGGNMAAPTPYPITSGIISNFVATNGGFIDQPSITDGILTDIGSVVNVPAGYVPVAGTYESALNYDGDGSGARVTINVTNDFLEDVPIAINTIPSFTGTVGVITGSVTPAVNNGEPGTVVSSGTLSEIVTDDGSLAQNSGDPAFVPATIELNYDAAVSPSYPVSATLISGGAGYSLQAGDQINIPPLAVNENQFLDIVVDIGAVQEFTNGTAVYTDNGANTAAGSGAAVSVTVGRGGLDITPTLVDPDVTPGAGYSDTEQITIQLPGSMPNSGELTYDIDTVQDEYYTDTNYAVALLNSGGEGYSVSDILTTNDVISFRDPTTSDVVNGGLQLQVGAVTSQTNKSVFTGFGAVEFLRGKGWTVRVES